MSNMSKKRMVFCSESDFQFSFALELKRVVPTSSIFLEKCICTNSGTYYIDLVFVLNNYSYYIEFKYQTSRCLTSYSRFCIDLKDQGAQDLLRYDYLKDIHRLQDIYNNNPVFFGGACAIVLTNDRLLYKEPTKYDSKVLDYNFRIHDRMSSKYPYPVPGLVSWNNTLKSGQHWTKNGKRKQSFNVPIIQTNWTLYMSFKDNNNINQDFRYLANYVPSASSILGE